MNVFNEVMHDWLVDVFCSISPTKEERKMMEQHHQGSEYRKIHIVKAWRDTNNILCVSYDNGKFFHYKKDKWW